MKSRLFFLSALACTLMAEAETGSPAGGAAAAPAAPADEAGTRIRPDVANYQTVKTPNGSSTKICGDAVSLALVGATLDEAYSFVSKVVGISEDELRAKYGARNVGQQRMFLGNLIRGASQGKDAEKKARIEAAFQAALPEFRKVIDARQAKEQEARDAAKAAKQKEKDDAKAKKEQDKKDAAAKRAQDAIDKKAKEDAAKAKPQADASTKPAGDAKPAPTPAKPSTPAQPK